MACVAFPGCTVEWEPHNRRAVTRFADGSEAYACPHDTPEYHAHAAEKSTGDVDLYCWQHDLAHCIVALMAYGGTSKVLWALAHNEPTDTAECDAEEQAAQQFQRAFFLRT
jgi:hypothetical protein